jgi:hypothetical protein
LWQKIGLLVLAIWCGLAGQSRGEEIVLADFSKHHTAVPSDWELVVTSGAAKLQLVADTPGQALHLQSDQASFGLQKRVRLPLHPTPYLAWRWKVTQIPRGGDFRQPQTDDQAAQLIVAFSKTRFLSYIWDSTVPQGTHGAAPAPPFRRILALVLQSGPQALGTWITEKRNLVEDYARLFGEPPDAIEGVRIQINSQHTRSQAEAYWQSIVLTGDQQVRTQPPDQRVAAAAAWAPVSRP